MHQLLSYLDGGDFPPIARARLTTVQVNLGYRCNQSCIHCHVAAGPTRTEIMDRETAELVLRYLELRSAKVLDLTGGAPEMNPQFRWLVAEARRRGMHVIDRCNLTILNEPGYADVADFLAAHEVEVVASLPCYLEHNVDRQRGAGVFERSIAALRRLNALGYGHGRPERLLTLVYNPQGAVLPPPQRELEQAYRDVLRERFGIEFDRLFALANMPIQRFGSMLVSQRRLDEYLALLRDHHRAENVPRVMCRNLISVDWRGYVYDCDFNQMLGLPLGLRDRPCHLTELLDVELSDAPISVARHCYGCTAGAGSGCGGALS